MERDAVATTWKAKVVGIAMVVASYLAIEEVVTISHKPIMMSTCKKDKSMMLLL